MHIMIDLETWGTKAGSALRSLGAVVFHPERGELGEEFYANISDASCEALGLVRDHSTVVWWSEQSDAAQEALLVDPQPLGDVLIAFNKWWTDMQGQQVWGHGANFDPVLLEAAYDAACLSAPWKFWNVRCCRTILACGDRKPQRHVGVHHNALDDAKAQAKAVMAAFRHAKFRAV